MLQNKLFKVNIDSFLQHAMHECNLWYLWDLILDTTATRKNASVSSKSYCCKIASNNFSH